MLRTMRRLDVFRLLRGTRRWPLGLVLAVALASPDAIATPPDPGPLPVEAHDATWGEVAAPVTLVGFADLECPYCDKVLATLDALRAQYGPAKLRIVHKDFPLAFHKRARHAAEIGVAIQTLEGSDAFFSYQAQILTALAADETPMDVVRALKLPAAKIERLVRTGTPKQQVEADATLGKKAGVRGTPAFFVNGVFLSGAQPKTAFAALIDEQLAAAAELTKQGVAKSEVSLHLTKENFARKAGKPEGVVWKVPVAGSPQLGPDTALVTWVLFSDYQCPYCVKLMPAIEKLRSKYKSDLRVVWKHNPLSFHAQADEAAALANEAFARRGHAGFWKASEALFAAHANLDEPTLVAIAEAVGLDPKRTLKALADGTHDDAIERDQLLARDVGAKGTPTSFINGRVVRGHKSADELATLIDEELASAQKLVRQGVGRRQLYDHLMKTAKGPPPPPKKAAPALDDKTPTRGPRHAKVTMQIFVDFESAFWLRSVPVVRRLEKTFAGKLRLAFRHKPLPFHSGARRAHAAAAETFAQKGHVAFWKLYDLIAENPHSLEEASLTAHAKSIGLDTFALAAAWADQRHESRIDDDIALATDLSISSVPAFLINDYYVNGAKSYVELARVVELALQ